jgi:hypothetical protein
MMKKLLSLLLLIPSLLFSANQPKNAQIADGVTFDANNIIIAQPNGKLMTIPVAWNATNSTVSFTGNLVGSNMTINAIGGSTGDYMILIGNGTTGRFEKGNITVGSNMTRIKSGNNIVLDSIDTGGGGSVPNGMSLVMETANLGTMSADFFISGNYGTAADVLGNYTVVTKAFGTVATPTVNVAPGAVPNGTVVTFSSTTPSLTNFRSTTNGTDPTYTIGTAGNSVTVIANTTIEVVANKQGWITSPVGSFAYTVTAGIPTPDLLHWPLNGPPGTTITASVGPGSTTNTGTLNNDFLSMAAGNLSFQSSSNVTYSTNIVTLALWIKFPNNAAGPILRSQHINDIPSWEIGRNGATFAALIRGATGSRNEEIIEPFGAAPTPWGHLAVVFDNSTATGDVKIYINGTVAATSIAANDKTGTANFAAGLVSVKSIFSEGQVVDLDDVRLYAGELTAGQISAIHAAGRP